MIIEITQRRRGFYDKSTQVKQDEPGTYNRSSRDKQDKNAANPAKHPDFVFRGGTTLVFDLQEEAGYRRKGSLRYVIRKRISDDTRLRYQAEFLEKHRFGGFGITYSSSDLDDYGEPREPFALVHRGV